jgi:hypothetical protein
VVVDNFLNGLKKKSTLHIEQAHRDPSMLDRKADRECKKEAPMTIIKQPQGKRKNKQEEYRHAQMSYHQ